MILQRLSLWMNFQSVNTEHNFSAVCVCYMLMQECSIFCHISHIIFLWYLCTSVYIFFPGGKSRVKWKLLSIVTIRDFWVLREIYEMTQFSEVRVLRYEMGNENSQMWAIHKNGVELLSTNIRINNSGIKVH